MSRNDKIKKIPAEAYAEPSRIAEMTINKNPMTQRISKSKRFFMMNPIIQFFKFIWLSSKILVIVAGGHGGTRKAKN